MTCPSLKLLFHGQPCLPTDSRVLLQEARELSLLKILASTTGVKLLEEKQLFPSQLGKVTFSEHLVLLSRPGPAQGLLLRCAGHLGSLLCTSLLHFPLHRTKAPGMQDPDTFTGSGCPVPCPGLQQSRGQVSIVCMNE